MGSKIIEKFDVRLYPRFTKTQAKNIKAEAKRMGLGEGETFRVIVDFYFNSKKTAK